MTEAQFPCLTVITRNEGCKILVFLEELTGPDNLLEVVEQQLRKEYRGLNDVQSWCFHVLDHNPIAGEFAPCRSVDLRAWLIKQASAAFGWGD